MPFTPLGSLSSCCSDKPTCQAAGLKILFCGLKLSTGTTPLSWLAAHMADCSQGRSKPIKGEHGEGRQRATKEKRHSVNLLRFSGRSYSWPFLCIKPLENVESRTFFAVAPWLQSLLQRQACLGGTLKNITPLCSLTRYSLFSTSSALYHLTTICVDQV